MVEHQLPKLGVASSSLVFRFEVRRALGEGNVNSFEEGSAPTFDRPTIRQRDLTSGISHLAEGVLLVQHLDVPFRRSGCVGG